VGTYIRKIKNTTHSPDFQNQLWTVISLGVNAVFPGLLVFAVTRQIGVALAGLLGYALATADLPASITLFGVRSFQNIDVKQEVHFNIYLGQRTLCAILASLGYFIFLLISDLDAMQLIVALLIYFFTLTNSYADVFLGDLQQKGKMRVAGKMRTSILGAALLGAVIALLITQSLVVTVGAAAVVTFLGYILWIWIYRKHFGAIRVKMDIVAIKKLTLIAFPIFVSDFITVYIINAQKYYLEAFVSFEAVAIYSYLMLPVTLTFLVSAGFFQGAIATKTAQILATDIRHFKKRVTRQLAFSFSMFIPFVIFVYFFGVQLLSWLYATDLSQYRLQLTLISVGAMIRAPVFVLGPVLIMLRSQKQVFYGTIAIALTSGSFMWFLVSNYGLYGAAFSGVVIFLPQTIIYYVLYRIALRKMELAT